MTGNQVTGKKGRFADEIGVAPKRKGSGFWDASCLKMQSLGLGALRVYGLGLTQTNHAPLTKPQSGQRDTQ